MVGSHNVTDVTSEEWLEKATCKNGPPSRLPFETLREAYEFFQQHSTEAGALATVIGAMVQKRGGPGYLLDFGSGAGEFLARLLAIMEIPSGSADIVLVEPDKLYLRQAVGRLQPYCCRPVAGYVDLNDVSPRSFTTIICNHVLYFVENMAVTVDKLVSRCTRDGAIFISMARSENALVELWQRIFALAREEVPFLLHEDLQHYLESSHIAYQRQRVESSLRFRDTRHNRGHIFRFTLGHHLERLGRYEDLLALLDPYARGAHLELPLSDDIFIVGNAP